MKPILVIGGGIAGLTAAIEASEAGAEVYLVEKTPWIGGRVLQMHRYFPKMCPPACGVEIHRKRLRTTSRVHLMTGAEVVGVEGGQGDFSVTVRTSPRGVNDLCTACGECVPVCPKDRANDFDLGLSRTKAIFLPFPEAHPARYAIDADACDGPTCGKCVEACRYQAIELSGEPFDLVLSVGSIIVATGWQPYDADRLETLGGGRIENVVTNLEIERMASPDGPTKGRIHRPSDGESPKHVAFVQCAGSRDELHLEHCSTVCCAASLKQVRYLFEQDPAARVTIFYIDRRMPGRLEEFLSALEGDERMVLIRGRVGRIEEDVATGGVILEAEDTITGHRVQIGADLAVLAVGMVPQAASSSLPGEWTRDAVGFLAGGSLVPNGALAGCSPGVFAAGCAKRPGDVSSSVKDATASVMKALQVAR